MKVLKQAKSLAYHFEEFTIIFQLIQMEEEILFSHGILHFTAHLEKLKKEREEITQKIQNLNELKLLKVLARELQFIDMPQITNPENHPRVFANPFLEDKKNINSLKAQPSAMKWCIVMSNMYSSLSNCSILARRSGP